MTSPSTPKSRFASLKPWSLTRTGDEWHIAIAWKPLCAWVIALPLVAWLVLSAAAFTFVRIYREVPEVTYTHIAFPWRWDEYRLIRAENYYQKSKQYLERSEWRAAAHALIVSVQKNPAHREARLDLARFFVRLRRYDLAESSLLDGLAFHGNDPVYLSNVFQFLIQLQNDHKAIEVGRTLLDRPDANPVAKNTAAYWSAVAHFYRGNFDRAEDLLQTTSQLALSREARILTTKIEWERGYPELVLIFLRQLSDEFPRDDEISSLLASRYRSLGRITEARQLNLLRQIAAPTAVKPRIDLLQLYTDTGDTTLAQREIEDVLRDFANNPDALLLLGEFAANNGQTALARRLYAHYRTHDLPWEAPALLSVEAEIVAGHYQAALDAARELIANNPHWGRRYYALFNGFQAIAYQGLGDRDAASLYLKNFLSQTNVRSEQLTAISRRLDSAGAHAEARDVLAHAVTEDPLNQAALTQLIQLDLKTGRMPELPALLSKLLTMRRPSPDLLRRAHTALSSDRWYFLPNRAATLDALVQALDSKTARTP